MRPGKPLLYGRLGNQRVLGLPGNPVSALRLRPCLPGADAAPAARARREAAAASCEAVLGEDARSQWPARALSCGRSRTGRLTGNGGSRPLPSQDSSLMADFARADCLIVRAPNAPALARGERVRIIPLDG